MQSKSICYNSVYGRRNKYQPPFAFNNAIADEVLLLIKVLKWYINANYRIKNTYEGENCMSYIAIHTDRETTQIYNISCSLTMKPNAVMSWIYQPYEQKSPSKFIKMLSSLSELNQNHAYHSEGGKESRKYVTEENSGVRTSTRTNPALSETGDSGCLSDDVDSDCLKLNDFILKVASDESNDEEEVDSLEVGPEGCDELGTTNDLNIFNDRTDELTADGHYCEVGKEGERYLTGESAGVRTSDKMSPPLSEDSGYQSSVFDDISLDFSDFNSIREASFEESNDEEELDSLQTSPEGGDEGTANDLNISNSSTNDLTADENSVIAAPNSMRIKKSSRKFVHPEEISFFLLEKGIDVKMVNYDGVRDCYEVFISSEKWYRIEEKFHQHFDRESKLKINIRPENECGELTELVQGEGSLYNKTVVKVSIYDGEQTVGNPNRAMISLFLESPANSTSASNTFMLSVAHLLKLEALERKIAPELWKYVWGIKRQTDSQQDERLIQFITNCNQLLGDNQLRIEVAVRGETVFYAKKIVGFNYDMFIEAKDWCEARGKSPPDYLPSRFVANDAILVELQAAEVLQHDDAGSWIPVPNNQFRRIEDIHPIGDLTEVSIENIHDQCISLMCNTWRFPVKRYLTSRTAEGFADLNVVYKRMIPTEYHHPETLSRGHSGIQCVDERKNADTVISVGALHSNDETLGQNNFIPIWQQLKGMKYLSSYDVLDEDVSYRLMGSEKIIDFRRSGMIKTTDSGVGESLSLPTE